MTDIRKLKIERNALEVKRAAAVVMAQRAARGIDAFDADRTLADIQDQLDDNRRRMLRLEKRGGG